MSQSEENTTPKIKPTIERIKEITLILMNPENKVAKRLQKFQLYEYIYIWLEDWDDPIRQRYQPRMVAFIIAMAESKMKIYTDALDDHKKTKEKTKEILKNESRRLKKGIETIEKVNRQKFKDLPPEVRMSSLFKNEELRIPYIRAFIDNVLAGTKGNRLTSSETRPKQKPFNAFCTSMKSLFYRRTGKNPDYQLIADLSNLFNLTSHKQTANTIRQRLHKLSKK